MPVQRLKTVTKEIPPVSAQIFAMTAAEIREGLQSRICGQNLALEKVIPYITTYSAGLCSDSRPAGVFLMLGPTGVGKTASVEALAEVLHGDAKKLIRIDCGQFALQHEVAKLLGAPPGYLGHRETTPLLTQSKLNGVTTEACPLAIVLFDEIEKAHPSMYQMLLSIADKAQFSLGDNTTVDFSHTLVFYTSNLGAREMQNTLAPELGFCSGSQTNLAGKMERISMVAVRKRFSPEFVNRIDEIITYSVLTPEAITGIFTLAIDRLRNNIFKKYADKSFMLILADDAVGYLTREGFSDKYGARELSRVIFRRVTQPLSNRILEDGIAPGAVLKLHLNSSGELLMDTIEHDVIQRALAKEIKQ